jgi:hypothetical protein
LPWGWRFGNGCTLDLHTLAVLARDAAGGAPKVIFRNEPNLVISRLFVIGMPIVLT